MITNKCVIIKNISDPMLHKDQIIVFKKGSEISDLNIRLSDKDQKFPIPS